MNERIMKIGEDFYVSKNKKSVEKTLEEYNVPEWLKTFIMSEVERGTYIYGMFEDVMELMCFDNHVNIFSEELNVDIRTGEIINEEEVIDYNMYKRFKTHRRNVLIDEIID